MYSVGTEFLTKTGWSKNPSNREIAVLEESGKLRWQIPVGFSVSNEDHWVFDITLSTLVKFSVDGYHDIVLQRDCPGSDFETSAAQLVQSFTKVDKIRGSIITTYAPPVGEVSLRDKKLSTFLGAVFNMLDRVLDNGTFGVCHETRRNPASKSLNASPALG